MNPKIIVVYGPTISEKTGLATNIANHISKRYDFKPELISADSKKIYKDMVVGQAYPYNEKTHIHMFDIIDSLEKPFSLYQYKKMTEEIIDQIHKRGNLPIIYGGAAIIISSILENWNVPENYDPKVDYKKEFGKSKSKYEYIILIPKIKKTLLFGKIDNHVKNNIDRGLLNEVIKLAEKYKINPLAKPTKNILFQSIGYKEFFEYCYRFKKDLKSLNKKDLIKIRQRTTKNTKNFARRQLKWIPKMKGEKHFITSYKQARKIMDNFLDR